ncbi:MAG: hypothetical protein U0Z53_11700 [Blastocatellia bacterium]
MNLILFLLALALWWWAGLGLVWLLAPTARPLRWQELFGLAVPCGSAVISVTSFVLGWWLAGTSLRMTVTALCLLTGAAGFIRWRRGAGSITWPVTDSHSDYLWLTVLALQAGFVFWLSVRSALLWDGLFNWEIKAQLAFQNGGRLPVEYFTSPALQWSHPEYPLLLPLTEAWFFGWLGAAHQGMIKLLFPLFYLAATGLLAAGGAVISRRRVAWLPAVLLFFLPQLLFREGSVTSGYADFPLAVCYLAAVLLLAEYRLNHDPAVLRLMGWMAATLPWVKQEGALLWLCVCGLAAVSAVRKKQVAALIQAMMPGAVVIVSWMIFIRLMKAPVGQDYLPFTISTLRSNLTRLPVIGQALLAELINWRRWSLLWPGLLIVLPLLRQARWRSTVIVMSLTIALPLAFDVVVYLFISEQKNTLRGHIEASLPRLLTHVAPIAVLLLWLGLTAWRRDSDG